MSARVVARCKWTVHKNTASYSALRAVGSVSAIRHFCLACSVKLYASLKVKNALEQSVHCLEVCAICNPIYVCLIPSVGLWVIPV